VAVKETEEQLRAEQPVGDREEPTCGVQQSKYAVAEKGEEGSGVRVAGKQTEPGRLSAAGDDGVEYGGVEGQEVAEEGAEAVMEEAAEQGEVGGIRGELRRRRQRAMEEGMQTGGKVGGHRKARSRGSSEEGGRSGGEAGQSLCCR